MLLKAGINKESAEIIYLYHVCYQRKKKKKFTGSKSDSEGKGFVQGSKSVDVLDIL
jgi:hypothetical protein